MKAALFDSQFKSIVFKSIVSHGGQKPLEAAVARASSHLSRLGSKNGGALTARQNYSASLDLKGTVHISCQKVEDFDLLRSHSIEGCVSAGMQEPISTQTDKRQTVAGSF